MEYLLKSQENRLRSMVENIEKKYVERLEVHAKHSEYDFQKLVDVSKECHEVFIEQV